MASSATPRPIVVAERPISSETPSGYQTPYDRFLEGEGIPINGRGCSSLDLEQVEVEPWDRKQASGAYVDAGFQITNPSGSQVMDGYVLQIDAGHWTRAEQGIYEELFYVVSGSGTTELTWAGGEVEHVSWGPSAMVSIPPNCRRRHLAEDGGQARLFVVSTLPGMVNIFRDREFIFGNAYSFPSTSLARPWRVDNASGAAFDAISTGAKVWELDQVSDVEQLELAEWAARGRGSGNRMFQFGENGLVAHVSEVPVGMYKKAHHHEGQGGVGGFILSPRGRGYTLYWDRSSPRFAEAQQRARVEWGKNVLFHYETDWFHQHFNSGDEPARYLAIYAGSSKYPGFGYFRGREGVSVDIEHGGRQVSFDLESPEVLEAFRLALNENEIEMVDPATWRVDGG